VWGQSTHIPKMCVSVNMHITHLHILYICIYTYTYLKSVYIQLKSVYECVCVSASDVDKDLVRTPGMGRITGSASIETLVRVGIEKENGLAPDSKMVVLHDFTPCVDDELEVKRGQVDDILMITYK